LRPLGSPLPLGVSGLAIASLLVTGLELGWIPMAQGTQVGFLLLVTAVPLQTIAAAFSLPGRDSPAAVGMGVLAAAWAAVGLTHLTERPGATSAALGLVLLMCAGLLLTSVISQATGKLLTAIVMGLAAVRFVLAGLFELTGSAGWEHASGGVGIAVASGALSQVDGMADEAGVRQQL